MRQRSWKSSRIRSQIFDRTKMTRGLFISTSHFDAIVLDKSPHSEKRPAAFVNSASRCQPGSLRDCTVVRQRHCPSPRPGIFIRAVDPKPRTSCNGTTASAALEARARRIISHTASRASPGRAVHNSKTHCARAPCSSRTNRVSCRYRAYRCRRPHCGRNGAANADYLDRR